MQKLLSIKAMNKNKTKKVRENLFRLISRTKYTLNFTT